MAVNSADGIAVVRATVDQRFAVGPGEQVGGEVLSVRHRVRQPVEVRVQPEAHLCEVLGTRARRLPTDRARERRRCGPRAPLTAGPAGRRGEAHPSTSRRALESEQTTSQPSRSQLLSRVSESMRTVGTPDRDDECGLTAKLACGRLGRQDRTARPACVPCRSIPLSANASGSTPWRRRPARVRRPRPPAPISTMARPPERRSNSCRSDTRSAAASRDSNASSAWRCVSTKWSFRHRRRGSRRSRTPRHPSTDRRAHPENRSAAPCVRAECVPRHVRGTLPVVRSRRRLERSC